MEEKETFTILDENNNEVEAEILTIIEVNNQEYVIYSTSANADEDNVFVSKIIKNEDGSEDIVPITDENERDEIHKIVEELINSEM